MEISRAGSGDLRNIEEPRTPGAGRPDADKPPDGSDGAGLLSVVRGYVAALMGGEVVRADRVEAAREVVESGEVDSAESAEEAARRILRDGI